MLYIVILLLLILLSYNYDYLQKKQGKYAWYSIVLVIFVLVAGLRYRIGLDTIRYMSSFQKIPDLFDIGSVDFDSENYDPLYFLLSSLAKTIYDDFYIMQFLQAILVNVVVFRFIRLNTKNIFFGVLLYYIFLYSNFMCEVMRESCAVSMVLLGYEYLKDNKVLKFSIFLVLAYLFHSSAIVLFLIPLLKVIGIWDKFKLNKYSLFIFAGVLWFGYFLQPRIFPILLGLSMTDRINSKLEVYYDLTDLTGQIYNIFGIISNFLQFIIPCALSIIITRMVGYKYFKSLTPFALSGIFVAIFTIPIALFYRYNNYFFPFMLIVMSEAMFPNLKDIRGKKILIVFNRTMIIFAMFAKLYGFFGDDGASGYKQCNRYYPYTTIFSREIDLDRENLFRYYDAN